MELDQRIYDNAPFDLRRDGAVIVAAYVGSHSHGTYIPKEDAAGIDDVDILGSVLPPVDLLVGLDEWQHWVEMIDELDVTFFSLRKLVALWLKSNPNVLGLLWMRPEDFIVRSEPFERFRDARQAFVCTQVADAFGGYAMSQLRAIHKNRHEGYMGQKRRVLVERYGYDVKHAAHLVRLLRMAVEFLEEGTLNVYRMHDADQLRSIKRGEWELEQVQREAGELFARLEGLKERSTLPVKPDRGLANRLLIEVTEDWVRAQAA